MSFAKITEQSREKKIVEQNLNNLGVPGEGITWSRILAFAQDFEHYKNTTLINEPEPSAPASSVPEIQLSDDQQRAWGKLLLWLGTEEPYFILRGYAGTGKSFLLKMLTTLKYDLYFTAPTNKATKVLSRFVNTSAKTTFSQLGLRMSADDDKLVMEFGANPPYFPRGSILVVDEASMVSTELCDFIEETRKRTGVKILYVGDPAQLPPVNEKKSKAWTTVRDKQNFATLKQVMRYDNQLLALATRIRDNIKTRDYSYPIHNDNDGEFGVFMLGSQRDFVKHIRQYTSPDDFVTRKVVAWRNKTVTAYNTIIRKGFGFENVFHESDIILLAEPVEENGVVIAHIDDEFRIQSVYDSTVKTPCKTEIEVYKLVVKDEEQTLTLNVPKDAEVLQTLLTQKASQAKMLKGPDRRVAWRDFWDTKALFNNVRYGYAITAHRSQGSSYTETFVDQQDILVNKNKREGLKCLYVACTRATTNVFTY